MSRISDAFVPSVGTDGLVGEATDETWMDAIEEPGELERDNTMIKGENGKGMVWLGII